MTLILFHFYQKCMETKNTILARQKEMQLSLDKVKHLIRLIQAFNFNQALAETDGKVVRVQDGPQIGPQVGLQVGPQVGLQVGSQVASEAAPEINSVEKLKAGGGSSVSSKQEEQTGGGANCQLNSTILTNCPGVGAGGKVEPGVGGQAETGLHVEVQSKPETEVAPLADIPVTTTNGTAEPMGSELTGAERCPTGGCAANPTSNSENKIAAVSPAETAAEEMNDSSSNSKTSEPSQHRLPALVCSLDNKK